MMSDPTTNSIPPHPAKFSPPVLDVIGLYVHDFARERKMDGRPTLALDPFAGIGGAFGLTGHCESCREVQWLGVEIEPEWADADTRIITGDSRRLTTIFHDHPRFDLVVTSCTYGNRMADKHEAKDPCSRCGGSGVVPVGRGGDGDGDVMCSKCKGSGLSPRRTYRHLLGRQLTEGNSGGMQWGPAYRALHEQVWLQVAHVTHPGAWFILNVSDHIRAKARVPVTRWHIDTILGQGYFKMATSPRGAFKKVSTSRMRYGENSDARIDGEAVIVFERVAA